ncbi:hypothetical protein; putative exported protein [Xenorhabdus bovienii str. Jollieti]|uniref:Uncharacterized protein n=1 Tax=Xenorhabdus bovienii (strain SS-2004) TaxID=406818 RepID=D3V498_XENBS|nr:hypothetical protein; putative exported protein [Xenorhabdus bovienii SS-2004]CDH28307.1 hypothetical protein; putative exported protein [Xenorhabdus bovienii str. Jollieti]
MPNPFKTYVKKSSSFLISMTAYFSSILFLIIFSCCDKYSFSFFRSCIACILDAFVDDLLSIMFKLLSVNFFISDLKYAFIRKLFRKIETLNADSVTLLAVSIPIVAK